MNTRCLVISLLAAGLIAMSGLATSFGTGCGGSGSGEDTTETGGTTEEGGTTNNCPLVSDDFSADSHECWSLTQINPSNNVSSSLTWANILQNGALTFNTAQGTLDYSSANDDWSGFVMDKAITFDSDLWELRGKISVSGVNGMGASYAENIALELCNSFTWSEMKCFSIGVTAGFGGDEPVKCMAAYNSTAGQGPQAVQVADCSGDGTYRFKLSAATGTIVPQVSDDDGANWTNMEVYSDRDEPFPSPAQIREEMRYLLLSIGSIDNTMRASIDEITTTGISVGGGT